MDNSSDFEKYLSNDDALRELAKADAIGIANYYGLIEKSSGDKHTLDSSWRELYSFIRLMSYTIVIFAIMRHQYSEARQRGGRRSA
jgi:hypothetical protein